LNLRYTFSAKISVIKVEVHLGIAYKTSAPEGMIKVCAITHFPEGIQYATTKEIATTACHQFGIG